MVAVRIIPCLDVRDGRVVKGVRFQGLVDSGDPVERATVYEAQGADELCILDVSATPEGRSNAVETVAAVRRGLGIPLTVGGGVRTLEDATRLLDAGADKVAVNTAALARPELLSEIHDRLGKQCTVLALDAGRREDDPERFEIITHSGTRRTGIDAAEWAAKAAALGAGEILATSWDRDGTGDGYDLDLLRALRAASDVPIIASGGARHAEHMAEELDAGASAVLAASIFHRGELTVAELKDSLSAAGHELRLTP
ncbi:MAG: HisA/HisF-related TIM barrel protein [Planctomycetota bacterium]